MLLPCPLCSLQAAKHADDLIQECAQVYQPLVVSGRYAMPFRVQLQYLWAKFRLLYWRNPGYVLPLSALTRCQCLHISPVPSHGEF